MSLIFLEVRPISKTRSQLITDLFKINLFHKRTFEEHTYRSLCYKKTIPGSGSFIDFIFYRNKMVLYIFRNQYENNQKFENFSLMSVLLWKVCLKLPDELSFNHFYIFLEELLHCLTK